MPITDFEPRRNPGPSPYEIRPDLLVAGFERTFSAQLANVDDELARVIGPVDPTELELQRLILRDRIKDRYAELRRKGEINDMGSTEIGINVFVRHPDLVARIQAYVPGNFEDIPGNFDGFDFLQENVTRYGMSQGAYMVSGGDLHIFHHAEKRETGLVGLVSPLILTPKEMDKGFLRIEGMENLFLNKSFSPVRMNRG